MRAVTRAQMQALDRRATEEYGIPSLLLMENAGRGVAEMASALAKAGRVAVCAGKGNNAGDGFVATRHLFNRGYAVTLILASDPAGLKGDAALNWDIVSRLKIPAKFAFQEDQRPRIPAALVGADLILDALFGIGLNAPVSGVFEELIRTMNGCGRPVLAVDIPSGLDADTGRVLGIAVKAAQTATLGLPKKGLFTGEGPNYSGKVGVIDIGLPKPLTSAPSGRELS